MPEAIELLIKEITIDFGKVFKINIIAPSVYIVDSRKEMNEVKGYQTEPWLVGTVKDKVIYLLDKDKFETDSNHPRSDFDKVLKHEIAHLYITAVAGTNKPFWLNEGIACYLAGQVKSKPSSENIVRLRSYYGKIDPLVYQIGYFWVSYLISKFSIAKIVEFLHEWKQAKQNPEEFEGLFEDHFGFGLNKESILEIIRTTGHDSGLNSVHY